MWPVVWKASSTIVSSWSDAAWWNTEKMFFQPERMLAAWEFTIWATQRITMSRIVGDLCGNQKKKSHYNLSSSFYSWIKHILSYCAVLIFLKCMHPNLFFFMMCSNGLRKSFWKRKLASSPFSKNFIESCLKESTAKMATSSLGLQPTYNDSKGTAEEFQ